MPYNNRQYNTRNSTGRYNVPGQFVSGGEMQQQQQQQYQPQQQFNNTPYNNTNQYNNTSFNNTPNNRRQQQQKPNVQTFEPPPPVDIEMKPEISEPMMNESCGDGAEVETKPAWMKSKMAGVRKVSTKERRRRQNETLRRLLTPKNALMVLNEMTAGENIAQNFKVEQTNGPNFSYKGRAFSFCADLNIKGSTFKGYGENKMMARNSAAEQAIREIFLKKMNKMITSDGGNEGDNPTEGEEEPLPMIQLASFALQKLFAEWECDGHKVPHFKSQPQASESSTPSAPAAPTGRASPPVNAAQLHPCTLLSYMRPGAAYTQLAADGDRPQTIMYTMAVEVDGCVYVGKAQNKKEARKLAAKSACEKIFNIVFDPVPTANIPVVATAEK